ncbi:cilia- and flagella-associated protein 251-like, partial [Diachasma alloeum]|uniref:cilia- and flagella-associated protein 251-like n=1 Tax=Diachasma alloeum TaxID=454923 RepID=UPI0007382A0F
MSYFKYTLSGEDKVDQVLREEKRVEGAGGGDEETDSEGREKRETSDGVGKVNNKKKRGPLPMAQRLLREKVERQKLGMRCESIQDLMQVAKDMEFDKGREEVSNVGRGRDGGQNRNRERRGEEESDEDEEERREEREEMQRMKEGLDMWQGKWEEERGRIWEKLNEAEEKWEKAERERKEEKKETGNRLERVEEKIEKVDVIERKVKEWLGRRGGIGGREGSGSIGASIEKRVQELEWREEKAEREKRKSNFVIRRVRLDTMDGRGEVEKWLREVLEVEERRIQWELERMADLELRWGREVGVGKGRLWIEGRLWIWDDKMMKLRNGRGEVWDEEKRKNKVEDETQEDVMDMEGEGEGSG